MICKKIDTIEKLKDFIYSSKDEIDSFGLDKQELISLKEYLKGLRKLYSIYSMKIKAPFISITKKNNWIKDIQPNFNHFSNSVMDIIDYNGNIITLNKENGKYVVHLDPRYKDEKLCKEFASELEEIENISEEFVVDGEVNTASNNFSLRFQNFDTMDLRMNLQNFIDNSLSYENAEESALQYYSTFLSQNHMLKANKDKVIKKLYLKK